MARAQKVGLALGSMDAFVAAVAKTRALTLVTRNVKDFERIASLCSMPGWRDPQAGCLRENSRLSLGCSCFL